MSTCCSIDTYVALFSCFFNLFQLTEVDDFLLPGTDSTNGGFTLDFARPIEWICTCPLMQALGGWTRASERANASLRAGRATPGYPAARFSCSTMGSEMRLTALCPLATRARAPKGTPSTVPWVQLTGNELSKPSSSAK
jgi:hypothetical protein